MSNNFDGSSVCKSIWNNFVEHNGLFWYLSIWLINKHTNNNKTSDGWQITFYVINIIEEYKTKTAILISEKKEKTETIIYKIKEWFIQTTTTTTTKLIIM